MTKLSFPSSSLSSLATAKPHGGVWYIPEEKNTPGGGTSRRRPQLISHVTGIMHAARGHSVVEVTPLRGGAILLEDQVAAGTEVVSMVDVREADSYIMLVHSNAFFFK